jgi:hypothetical protein
MNNGGFALCLMIAFVTACDTESELKKSVFIEDPHADGLPLYSEWGYNTFGAYYDRTVLRSNDFDTPAKIIADNEATIFSLEGERINGGYGAGEPVKLDFILPGIMPATYEELVSLHDTSFDLMTDDVRLLVTIDGVTAEAQILQGDLTFIRAQNLVVDAVPMEVILSGRFNVKFIADQVSVDISDGRFDVGVGPDNFFRSE